MEMMKQAQFGIFLFTIAASGLALAGCPNTMPMQLLQDCIVSEGAGDIFPSNDYAYMDQYQEWLKVPQTETNSLGYLNKANRIAN